MEEKDITPKDKNVKKQKEKLHSNKIRIILEEIGMSQQELADIACDGYASNLSRIINGQRRCISLPIAIKISRALNRPVEEVFIYKKNEKN
jgi:DNA-binding XRE family transcriptional regulator